MNAKDTIIWLLSLALLLTFVAWIGTLGIERIERAECIKWQQQAEEYEGFYWTEWQKEQCNIK